MVWVERVGNRVVAGGRGLPLPPPLDLPPSFFPTVTPWKRKRRMKRKRKTRSAIRVGQFDEHVFEGWAPPHEFAHGPVAVDRQLHDLFARIGVGLQLQLEI